MKKLPVVSGAECVKALGSLIGRHVSYTIRRDRMCANTPLRKQEILSVLSANETKLKGFGVLSLSLFGSSVRGEETSASDLDFIVEFDKKTFDSYMDLKFFLEELFERRVDLVLADGIKPRLRAVILKEAVHAPGF